MALRSVKDFKILKLLKSNVISEIFEVRDKVNNIKYIMKKINKKNLTLNDQKLILERFEKLKRITSGNVVSVFDSFEEFGYIYIITEFIDGRPLSDLILYRKYSERVTVTVLLKFLIKICNGLDALHSQGIVHGDIKPANVFITSRNEVKIIDLVLGILSANRIGHLGFFDKLLYKLGIKRHLVVIGGTLPYLAPELIFENTPTTYSDIYSFGISLYVLLTGELPIPEKYLKNPNLIKLWHLNPSKIPRFPNEIKKDIPIDLENIILKSIAVDSNDRFESVNAIKKRLELVLNDLEHGKVY